MAGSGKSVDLTANRQLAKSARTFRLTVHPDKGDHFGVAIAEAYGQGEGPTMPVLTASVPQTNRVIDGVIAALKESGHPAGRLSTQRSEPIVIDEAAGVRLAVILMATQPITNNERIRRIVAGVNFMSIEETYYWYAKCSGVTHAQARKALRVLLADPNPRD